ncbi:hypothetical protein NKOR_03705 [Candidatus Nitrosopumilus koreensis AR1]|uniref:Uncharacterized protein n=1 Tax=Candidatus Nitrosopumilus koreensis AR1 TaxID=1229908 RepID=K0B6P5_9ARCH|nr:hypothetical protein [Candidatus Nitrosopumilus koreensis]AFS80635.1 hypothetical protein NKOR_03705 [Candidatus Nitrosopumilus koreensis AR1]
MKIDIPLPCPTCGGKMYSVRYESAFSLLKKEVGKCAKNVILKEIPKILKNQFAVHNSTKFFLNNF